VADTKGPAERAGEKIDDAARMAADKIDRATDRVVPTTQPVGAVKDLAPDYEDIRSTMGNVTETAFKSKGFGDFVGYFVDFDRNRLSKYAKETDFGDLNAKIDAFRTSWKTKYGHDFDITKQEVVYAENRCWIVQAEIGDSAKLASGKLTGPNAQLRADIDKRITGGQGGDRKTGMDKPGTPEADKNLNDPGRNIALVTFPESHGLARVDVPFIHEMPDSLRIDLPDSVDGPRLRDNLMKHYTQMHEQMDKWPADENEAYTWVSHHVFLALMDWKSGVDAK
jgi:hypothetical protein